MGRLSSLRQSLRHKQATYAGFTIVELLIVIAVIGILAGIVIVSYGAWEHNIRISQVKSDLGNAATAMENSRNFGSQYQNSLPATFTPSNGISLTVTVPPDGSAFCIDGTTAVDTSIQYYISSDTKTSGPQAGTCASRPVTTPPSTATGVVVSSSTPTQISLSWNSQPVATGSTGMCATDAVFINNPVSAQGSGSGVTITGLAVNTTYYCRVQLNNSLGTSAWSASVKATTVVTFGTVPAAANLRETAVGPTSSTVAWDGITCNLGSPSYRFVWVSPYSGTTTWGSATTATINNDQATPSTWKVESKCTYTNIDSSVATSSNRTFTAAVAPPSGSWGAIGWDGRFTFNAAANTFTCTGAAVEQYTIVATLIDYTSGTWTYPWSTSVYQAITNANQGARMTTYMQVRCYYNNTASTVLSAGSRTDYASVDPPGAVPGWVHVGNPKGERWSAVGCPAGTYAVYWAYAVGDYNNPIWGAYEAANFYGYDRAGYSYGNTMVNSYLMARCTSDFISSGYGPQEYARY